MLYLQIWRLLTPFFFFGTFSFNFLFNMIFTYRYCRMLEEGSFRGRTADFVYMFIFGCITTVVIIKICINSSCFKILTCCFPMLFCLDMCLVCKFIVSWAFAHHYVRLYMGSAKSLRQDEFLRPSTISSKQDKATAKYSVRYY